MLILAMKLTDDPDSTKIVYEKESKLYIRTGTDGFKTGVPVQAPLKSLLNKWGFRRIDNPPEFRDGDEMVDNLTNFSLGSNGMITYSK